MWKAKDLFLVLNRVDQMLGKPGLWLAVGERDKRKVTALNGLSHIENKVRTK